MTVEAQSPPQRRLRRNRLWLAGGGALAGAAIMVVIQVGCSQLGLPNWVQQIVTGGIIVCAVGLDQWRRSSART